ncbi:MAG TPA: NIL domain-containing protein [Verrucomicrobiae bacterium]
MAAKKAPKKAAKKVTKAVLPRQEQTRLWLMYPPKQITQPIIWEIAQKFKVITNVRQASVTGEIGIVCLELSGDRTEVKAAIKWLVSLGISVEPVEISVVES